MKQNRNYGYEHMNHMRRDQIIGLVLGTVLTATGAYTAYVSQSGLPILILGLACIALINELNRN